MLLLTSSLASLKALRHTPLTQSMRTADSRSEDVHPEEAAKSSGLPVKEGTSPMHVWPLRTSLIPLRDDLPGLQGSWHDGAIHQYAPWMNAVDAAGMQAADSTGASSGSMRTSLEHPGCR